MYDPTALDEEEYDEMDIGARREAERVMGKRDREEAATSGRLRRSLLYGMWCILSKCIVWRSTLEFFKQPKNFSLN